MRYLALALMQFANCFAIAVAIHDSALRLRFSSSWIIATAFAVCWQFIAIHHASCSIANEPLFYSNWYCSMASVRLQHLMWLLQHYHVSFPPCWSFVMIFLKHWDSLCPLMPPKLHVLLEQSFSLLPSLASLALPPCKFPAHCLHSFSPYPQTFQRFLHFPWNKLPLSTEERCTFFSFPQPLVALWVSLWISNT